MQVTGREVAAKDGPKTSLYWQRNQRWPRLARRAKSLGHDLWSFQGEIKVFKLGFSNMGDLSQLPKPDSFLADLPAEG